MLKNIRKMKREEIPECVCVIREAFKTVAEEFCFTAENAPRFTAFATTEERLQWHFEQEHRPMYVYCIGEKIVGYYSLALLNDGAVELNNLAVVPAYRHQGIGGQLLQHAFAVTHNLGCNRLKISIVEENNVLRRWYEIHGFVHKETKKFAFFPFTCGYMEKDLS